jgi:hypothetical protein
MAEQLPESAYERMSADERAKERLERQQLLVSLPKASLEQKYMAFAATLTVEVQENLEDLLLLANALPGAPAAVADGKNRLIQASRGALERARRTHKIALIAAKEGPDTAQHIFNPEPSYAGMNEEETKMLEIIRKEKEAAKKKENGEAGKSGRKGLAVKRASPYPGFKSGGYGGNYGGGYGGLNNWALQQLLVQQLAGNKTEGGQGAGMSEAAAAGDDDEPAGSAGQRLRGEAGDGPDLVSLSPVRHNGPLEKGWAMQGRGHRRPPSETHG